MRYRPATFSAIHRQAMTLLELILVLAILAVVTAIAFPLLSNFFHGRSQVEEARRLLAASRLARSEAINRSTAMEWWIDARAGTYGLRPHGATISQNEPQDATFQVRDGLTLTVRATQSRNQSTAATVFLPDGTCSEGGIESVAIQGTDKSQIVIERAETGQGYCVQE